MFGIYKIYKFTDIPSDYKGKIGKKIRKYSIDLYNNFIEKSDDYIDIDYDRRYSPSSYILIFFSVSSIGWMWEILRHMYIYRTFVNRGTMLGPWLPIYGTGAVLIVMLLNSFIHRPLILLPCIFILCGTLEYGTSFILEILFSTSWWNYNDEFMNINGRIYLKGLLFFTAGGLVVTYFIAPIVDELGRYMILSRKYLLCTLLIVIFSIDFIYSFNNPNQGKGISNPIKVNSEVSIGNMRKNSII